MKWGRLWTSKCDGVFVTLEYLTRLLWARISEGFWSILILCMATFSRRFITLIETLRERKRDTKEACGKLGITLVLMCWIMVEPPMSSYYLSSWRCSWSWYQVCVGLFLSHVGWYHRLIEHIFLSFYCKVYFLYPIGLLMMKPNIMSSQAMLLSIVVLWCHWPPLQLVIIYHLLFGRSYGFHRLLTQELAWRGCVGICWLRSNCGMDVDLLCPVCMEEPETVKHSLLFYQEARRTWFASSLMLCLML